MTRYGSMYGPNITFLGVDECDIEVPASYADADVVIVGAPFDGGTSYRSGARFGPKAMREVCNEEHNGSRESMALRVNGLKDLRVYDMGDVEMYSGDAVKSCENLEKVIEKIAASGAIPLVLGGDHTVTLGLLRALVKVHGPIAMIHFDSHLDTWDSYFGADRTHGTFMRRAFEEGLLIEDKSLHVGIRGPLYDQQDLINDKNFGFSTVRAADFDRMGVEEVIGLARKRVGDSPMYLSIDIDVLDPAFAPGTGTPEMGGFTSRELLSLVRGMPREQMIGADILEVAPAYDHAEITSLAAATLAYEIMSLMALNVTDKKG